MEEKAVVLEKFLSDINPNFEGPVRQVYQFLADKGYATKLQEAKSGHVVSFTDAKTKKTMANFVSRKKGPMIRIYADHISGYESALNELPAGMVQQISEASPCRRMLDPAKCNARCPMGYHFMLGGQEQKKCRYNCFMFVMEATLTPFILELLSSEVSMREVESVQAKEG